MNRIKIKIGIIGYLPFKFNRNKIEKWNSKLFDVVELSEFNINSKRSDTSNWEYSDDVLNKELPKRQNEDIFIGITYVPIKNNYLARRLNDNRVIVSLFGIYEDLKCNNIPAENLLLRVIYASALVYYIEKNIPSAHGERLELLHDDTRGCIYDMTGNKSDVIYSLNKPKLCSSCIEILKSRKVPNEIINRANKELKFIKKNNYYRIESFIKRKPILSLIITLLTGIIISVTANFIYDHMISKINSVISKEVKSDEVLIIDPNTTITKEEYESK